ncbi:hypothetical protein ACIA5C_02770 [Actinoplanes sp. NPDC051343]|uniref:hypothetical protein n=1 Tax=Actinoplanes sp. NPDC051343 TaxID=3363906 RepID=UPI0037BB3B02
MIEDAIDATPVEAGAARLHTALGPAPTHGDPILLERLAANLIDNALRYNVTGARSGSAPRPPAPAPEAD